MNRLERVQAELAARDWDALLVHRPDEIRYLTGVRGTLVRLLITPDDAVLLSHFIDLEQSRLEAPDLRRQRTAGIDGLDELSDLLRRWHVERLALGQRSMSLTYFLALSDRLAAEGVAFLPDQDVVRKMRLIKEDDELALIRRATEINDAAYHHVLPLLEPGVTEKEIAAETRHFMWQAGVEDIRFLVVQFGDHAALPHYYPTDRVLQPGHWVLMDWVPVVQGYASDVTRTVLVGEPTDRQRQVYELVREAQQAGLEAVRPGATGAEVDAAARTIIEAGGYGPFFGHSLGHGINEGPNLDVGSADVLEPGMVATVEPGIYIADWGGVRIEDTVVVTDDGVKTLPSTTKELVVLRP
jgi:Xaa-Pro aminopeptidase